MENYIGKTYERNYGANNIYNGIFEIRGCVDMYLIVEWSTGRYELMFSKSFYNDLKDGSLTELKLTNHKINNKIEKAIKYCKSSYVNESKGLPAMLLGDVAELFKIFTGEKINFNELMN